MSTPLDSPSPSSESPEIKPICLQQRQAFIDCMYLNDPCAQSGRASFHDCFQEILDQKLDRPFPEPCLKLYRDFLTCRRQMIDMRTRFRGYK